MGILDEAIREHLELKRQHGAEESELEGLESEAFGPADRPDATAAPEAQTEVISPGSSLTTPAGEGDQLDKVFEATRQAEAESQTDLKPEPTGEVPSEPAPATEAPTADAAPAAEAPAAEELATGEVTPADESASDEPNWPDAKSSQRPAESPAVEASTEAYDDHEGGDAGDALQRERLTLSDHPTEHYDVDAAIAEEQEIDVLSESSLSDELDRALDGPLEETPAAAAPPAPVEPAAPAESALPEEESVSDEFDSVFDDELEPAEQEAETEAEVEVADEPVTGEEGLEEDDDAETAEAGEPDFFDQDDPLEATPDFLEETPEHDRLWFEQKPPKDFEFGD